MKIRIMSDLHIESQPSYRPEICEDEKNIVLILAGDVCEIQKVHILMPFLAEMSERFKNVLYVPGNHEYYNGHLQESKKKLQKVASQFLNIVILDNSSVNIDGVNFIGSTLWTDIDKGDPLSMIYVANGLNDYRKIRTDAYRRIRPDDTIVQHLKSVRYLREALLAHEGEYNVVVTHHAPSRLSIHEKYAGDVLNAAYASDLSDIIEEFSPMLWIHGHMHDTFDYELYNTRIICNPKGYPRGRIHGGGHENQLFVECLTEEIGS